MFVCVCVCERERERERESSILQAMSMVKQFQDEASAVVRASV